MRTVYYIFEHIFSYRVSDHIRSFIRYNKSIMSYLTGIAHFVDLSSFLDEVGPLDMRDGLAVGPHRGEIHVLLHDLALLPSHWGALLSSGPHLKHLNIVRTFGNTNRKHKLRQTFLFKI